MNTIMIRPATILLMFGLCVANCEIVSAQAADDALRAEIKALGRQIKEFIDKKGGGSVAVGAFNAAAKVQGSGGPELQVVMSETLKELGLTLDTENSRFEIQGNYVSLEHPETKLLGVRLNANVIDSSDGAVLAPFDRFIFGEETVARLLGLAVKRNPNADAKQTSDDLKRAIKEPPTAIEETTITNGADSKYAVEILVKKGDKYEPRKPTIEKGKAFVEIAKGEIFAVRLINRSKHEAAVRLTIDGLNVFKFSETKPAPEYWVIPPGKNSLIRGWDKNSARSLEFKSVELHETALAKLNLKPDSSFGLVSASFSACWIDDASKPEDETTSRGAGFGQEIQDAKTSVSRTIGRMRETITVRYER